MLEVQTHLQTLELDANASPTDIKQAYKDLVTVWHPDRFNHNPRLRAKAEGKLKQLNQAYEALRSWRRQPASTPPASRSTTERATQRYRHSPREERHSRHYSAARQARTKTRKHNAAHRSSTQKARRRDPSQDSKHDMAITFDTAEFILQHYCFIGGLHAGAYQGGPFVLMACEDPPEVMLSVPCDSLRSFDRILLSIPCKSAGYFKQQEARRLLQLLHAQQ